MKTSTFRIYLYSPYCLLRPTTNRIYDMRLCDGLAGQGAEVTVVYPYAYMKDNIRGRDIARAYGLRNRVRTSMLLTPLHEDSPKQVRFIILMLAFAVKTLVILLGGIFLRRRILWVSRDAKSLIPAILAKKLFGFLFRAKVIYVASEVKSNRIFKWVVRHADGVMAGVTATRKAIQQLVPVPDERFMLSLAPVPEPIVQCSKEEARREINYTDSRPLIVYTGKLGMDVHELRYLFDAAKQLPEYNFLFTGGRAAAVEQVKKYCKERGVSNVLFTGFMNDSTYVRYYQLAADVLVSYYTAKDHLVEFNYPQKINEYMTTGNPVVTPDFPATQDVLNERNVIFVRPDDPDDLARGIRLSIENRHLSQGIALQALKDVRELTFERRTKEFLDFAERL